MDKRKIVQGVVLLLIVVLFAFFAFGLRENSAIVKVGDKAYNFELENMQKEKVKLEDFKGQVVVANFFATWCEPCKTEAKELEEFDQAVKASGKAQFIMIDIAEMQPSVQKFQKEYGLSSMVLFDYNKAVYKKYGLTGQPETLIIDKDGVLREHIIGPTTKDNLLYLVDKYQ